MDTSKRELGTLALSGRSRRIGLLAAAGLALFSTRFSAGGPASGAVTLSLSGLSKPVTAVWDVEG